jgi:hypothetical protein
LDSGAFASRLCNMRNISILWVWEVLAILFICQELSAAPEPPVLNVSTDLTQLPGKYCEKTNMLPNNPSQDSQPLLNDAIEYVSHYNSGNPAVPYTQIVATPGAYYFETTRPISGPNSKQIYALVAPENLNDHLQNVAIDLGGSSLFFADAQVQAFTVVNCQNVILSNFSIDYQTLPFTELRVQEVALDTNQIVAVPLRAFPGEPNYVDVYQLQQSEPNANFYGFDFLRHGRMNPSMARWNISPLQAPSNTLTLKGDFSIALIKPGDIFEVEARGGGPTISVQNSSSIQLKQLSIYSGGGVGIITNYCPFTSIENVKVIPRPHTNRLVSTNAGGIAVNSTAQNNVIRNCTISGTQDDCISGNSPAVGYVLSIGPSPSTLVLAEPNPEFISNGCQVYFVDPATGGFVVDPSSGETIICTVSSSTVSGSGKSETMQVTMTSTVPSEIMSQAMMYSTDTATRGEGLIIDSNDISSNRLARGIALSGQTGVLISNNRLSEIQEAGILCGSNYGESKGIHSTFGPVSNVSILQNHLDRTNIGTSPIGITMLAAIQILTINWDNGPASAEADENIYILDNKIQETPRTAIWAMNIGSGEISRNEIRHWGYDTTIPPHSHIPSSFHVTSSDFQQPLIIQSSSVIIGINPH